MNKPIDALFARTGAIQQVFAPVDPQQERAAPHDINSRAAEIYNQFVFDGDKPITAPDDLIRDLMPKSGLAFIAGQSQAGKTFVVIELACCLATGEAFFGKKVRERVGVAIMAGEGEHTITNRLEAAKRHRGIGQKLPVTYLGNVPNMLDEGERKALIQSLRKLDQVYRERFGVRLGAVIYDTLAATFDLSDENDNAEASKVTRIMREIGRETKTLSLPVHHYGGNMQAGLRGATAWRGNCDSILSVLADTDQVTGETKTRELALAKNRDGVAGPIAPFSLHYIELGRNEDDEPFGTCAIDVMEGGASTLGKSRSRKEPQSLTVLRDCITAALIDDGENFQITDGPNVRAVRMSAVRSAFFARYATGSDDEPEKRADAARKAFTRALEKVGTEFRSEQRGADEWIWRP